VRVVFCLDGPHVRRVTEAALDAVRLDGAELVLLHVRDSGPRDLIQLTRGRRGRPPLPPHRRQELEAAEQQRAEDLFAAARAAIIPRLPWIAFSVEVLTGRPEREIVSYLERVQADLVVLGARFAGRPGPASIGPVARFVLDHAPCSALLVRATAIPPA
jgi:nucleotide-binding universal stress UspA family protein